MRHSGRRSNSGNWRAKLDISFQPIAYVRSCFQEKFGIPRQSGLVKSAVATLEFCPPYDDVEAFAGLDGVSHIWVQFVFHQNRRQSWKPRVKAPRLGGNKTAGVFATRSPTRPNPIGLSVVKLDAIEKTKGRAKLIISGHDLLDGTPVLDIKPYLPYADCISEAINPFASDRQAALEVVYSPEALLAAENLTQEQRALITEVLQLDARPAFHKDLNRNYGTTIGNCAVKWRYQASETTNVRCFVESIVPSTE